MDVLLEHGAMLETEDDPVFSENSPFYLASLYGQTEVVKRLLSYQPSTSAFNFTQGEHIQENRLYINYLKGH